MMILFYIIFIFILFFFSCINPSFLDLFYMDTFSGFDSIDKFNSLECNRMYSPVEYYYKFNYLKNSRKIKYVVLSPQHLEPLVLHLEEILNKAESLFFNDASRPNFERCQIDKLCHEYKHLEYVLGRLYGYSKPEVYELVYRLLNGRTWYELDYLLQCFYSLQDMVYNDFTTFYELEFIVSFLGYTIWCASNLAPL